METGGRADKVVGAQFPGVGRATLARLFDEGKVRVNGRRAKKGDTLAAGDLVEVVPPEDPRVVPVAGALQVLYEDEAIIAIAKPPGMPSHPLKAGETGTLANLIVARWPECAAVGDDPREGGLAHRLDAGTSGVILAARSAEVWRALRTAFHEGRVAKTYLALVDGAVSRDGELDLGIEHDRVRGGVRVTSEGLPALTRWTVVERLAGRTLLRCVAETGRMHQVRAHLAFAGTPVVGDSRYGGPPDADVIGFFLHAERVELAHPVGGKALVIEAPLPPDRLAALERLR